MKRITLSDFLTDEEIQQAIELYKKLADTGTFAREVSKTIIEPNIERINKALGQENVPMYLAYAVEHAILTILVQGGKENGIS